MKRQRSLSKKLVPREDNMLHRMPASRQTSKIVLRLTLVLYIAIMSVDALRKASGLPGSSIIVIYALVIAIYIAAFSRQNRPRGILPRYLPLALLLLSIWCAVNAVIQEIPLSIALLGWSSYVFFVPLVYIGAEVMTDDSRAIKILRLAAIVGAVVGIGAIASAILGASAPALLQPIIPSAGVHTATGGSIYLAPSFFSDAEEACEQLLVSLFAWTALMLTRSATINRGRLAVLGVLIFAGLVAAERRAGIDIAAVGLLVLIVIGAGRSQASFGDIRLPNSMRIRLPLLMTLGMAAIVSVGLIDILGAKLIVSFLETESLGPPLKLMFSSAHPGALYGQGTGTSTQGANLLGAVTYTGTNAQGPYTDLVVGGRSFLTAEGGLAKTWLELGLIGLLLYGQIFIMLIGLTLRRFRALDCMGRALLILTLGLGILFLKGQASLDDPLIQPLYWLAAGGVWGRLRRSSAPAIDRDPSAIVQLGRGNAPLSATPT
jgi:hypothetical protein